MIGEGGTTTYWVLLIGCFIIVGASVMTKFDWNWLANGLLVFFYGSMLAFLYGVAESHDWETFRTEEVLFLSRWMRVAAVPMVLVGIWVDLRDEPPSRPRAVLRLVGLTIVSAAMLTGTWIVHAWRS